MNSQEIQDVLELSHLLGAFAAENLTESEAIAALVDWRDGSLGTVDPYPPAAAPEPVATPKPKPAKATRKAPAKAAASDEPDFEPSPDPSSDDEPDF